MTSRKILAFMLAEPFRPFRIHVTGGRCINIEYPEMIAIGRPSVAVYADPHGAPAQPGRRDEIPFTLLESVEPLEIKPVLGSP